MKKKKLSWSYIAFFIIGSVIAFSSCLSVLLFSLRKNLSISDFPSYAYSQYVDQSSTNQFQENSGGQLYEAESFSLSGSAEAEENLHASGEKAVGSLFTGSTLTKTITSKTAATVKLVLSTCFTSQTGKPVSLKSLLSLSLNGKDITDSVFIPASYNQFDFVETTISLIDLRKGENTFVLTSVSNPYTLDYLLLVSSKEKSEGKEIGNREFFFLAEESSQEYPACLEKDIDGAVILEDGDGFSVFFSNPEDAITFHIDSKTDSTSSLSLLAKKRNASANTPGVIISVNGEELNTQVLKNLTENYSLLSLGMVSLKKGSNSISIDNLGGYFLLKSITLNTNINFSPTKACQRYEAEDGIKNGGCSSTYSDSGSRKSVVGYNKVGSSVTFSLSARTASLSRLALRLSYVGEESPLFKILSLTLNGTLLPLPDTLVSPTDYDNYLDLYAGEATLTNGTNTLIVSSLSGNYNLDCLTFFREEAKGKISLEAEDLILLDSEKKEYSPTASNQYYVVNQSRYGSLSLFFYSEEDKLLPLSLYLSNSYPVSVESDSLFRFMVNSEFLEGSNVLIAPDSSLSAFKEVAFGSVSFKKGMNVLRIENQRVSPSTYGIDRIVLG
ncbi:MAG: hypothetical protein WCR16_03405 [Bacilli bacterium]